MAAKIAIIEDEVTIAEMYQFKLKKDGYTVEVARSGNTGLELVETFRPDLILLDLMLPEMTGDEILARIRAKDWGKSIKIIVLTNIGRDEAPARLRELNVNRYIVKAHYTPAQVVKVVEEVLESEVKGDMAT